jgi:hypothetical protein
MKHKHSELIKAWADGAQIQVYRIQYNDWVDTRPPAWSDTNDYRVKPEPKLDVIVYSHVVGKFLFGRDGIEIQQLILCPRADEPNIKYIFDGETGELKLAEVLK